MKGEKKACWVLDELCLHQFALLPVVLLLMLVCLF